MTYGQIIFEVLGTPSKNNNFDGDFLTSVADTVQELLISSSNDPNGPLCEPLRYEEVAFLCSRLGGGGFPSELSLRDIF